MSCFVETPEPPKRGDKLVVHGKECIVFHSGMVDGVLRVLVMRREDGKLWALSGFFRP